MPLPMMVPTTMAVDCERPSTRSSGWCSRSYCVRLAAFVAGVAMAMAPAKDLVPRVARVPPRLAAKSCVRARQLNVFLELRPVLHNAPFASATEIDIAVLVGHGVGVIHHSGDLDGVVVLPHLVQ